MKYTQCITKKRFKGKAICGDVNIPYGTICDVQGDYICHNGKAVCAITSQNAYDYFWGYDKSNPEQEIKRQKLARQLYDSAPADTGDELADPNNPWCRYGEIISFGMGLRWDWKKEILDYSLDKLTYLLTCLKKGERPVCIA